MGTWGDANTSEMNSRSGKCIEVRACEFKASIAAFLLVIVIIVVIALHVLIVAIAIGRFTLTM